MVVYLDGVMGLNFLVDWMLLLGVNRMAGFPPELGRTAAAAAVGSGYAGMCLIPGFGFLGSMLWRSVSLGVVSMTAFGLEPSALRRGALFVMLSMALGGLALCAGSSRFWEIGLCSGALVLLCRVGFRGRAGQQQFHRVSIRHEGQQIELTALADTGNALHDPITGEGIVIVDSRAAWELLGLTAQELRDPVHTLAQRPGEGFRLIPYHTVGTAGAFLLGLRCGEVTVDGRRYGSVVAFAPEQLGNGEYRGLTGGM